MESLEYFSMHELCLGYRIIRCFGKTKLRKEGEAFQFFRKQIFFFEKSRTSCSGQFIPVQSIISTFYFIDFVSNGEGEADMIVIIKNAYLMIPK